MRKQTNLTRLMGYAGKHRYLLAASWIFSAASALIALIPFIYIWKIVRDVLTAAPEGAANLTRYGWMAVAFASLSLLVYIMGLMCSHLAAFRIATNIRSMTMRHIISLPVGIMEGFGSGRIRKIVNECSAATETYLAHQLPDQAGAIATPCGLLVLLLAFDWRLGLLSLVSVALAFLIMTRMTGEEMKRRMNEYYNALDNMSNEAVEYIRGIPVVKTFGQTVFSFKRFKDSIDNYETWVVAYTKSLRLPMLFYTTAIHSVFAFLTAAGLYFTRNGVSDAFLLNLIFYIIVTPVIAVTLTRVMFMRENCMVVADSLRRIDSIWEMTPMPEPLMAAKPRDASVELQDASFSYSDGKNAVRDVSLRIEPGQTVALVGPSGGGKSTLACLISRFFDVKSGSVRIGGVDVRDISKRELMDMVGFVFQNSCLLKNSVLENVRLARPNASREEVLAALRSAQCMDIIDKLPDGIDTVIGCSGTFLSGGEQQRIAIARAMLKATPIVILDEATAFADPDNESRVQAAFAELRKDKTVIMIAHRLSTVVAADKIFVMKDGSVAEKGSHDELVAKGGIYAAMWGEYQTAALWKVQKGA